MQYKTIELEKLRLGLSHAISNELLDADVNVRHFITDMMVAEVRGFVWAEKESVRRQEIKYPRDWWQAVKERFAPRWFLIRYPVDYKVVVLDVKAIYPDFNPAMPKHQHRLLIQKS